MEMDKTEVSEDSSGKHAKKSPADTDISGALSKLSEQQDFNMSDSQLSVVLPFLHLDQSRLLMLVSGLSWPMNTRRL